MFFGIVIFPLCLYLRIVPRSTCTWREYSLSILLSVEFCLYVRAWDYCFGPLGPLLVLPERSFKPKGLAAFGQMFLLILTGYKGGLGLLHSMEAGSPQKWGTRDMPTGVHYSTVSCWVIIQGLSLGGQRWGLDLRALFEICFTWLSIFVLLIN